MPDTITTAAERYLIAVDKLHQVYGSTSACWGGAGGMSLTAHCGWGCDNPAHAHDQAEFVAAEAELRDALASPDAEPAMRLPRVADGCCCTWCSEDRGANHSETWDRALAAHDAEVAAKAWDEGLSAAYGHVYRQEDADAAGQGHLVPSPANPYAADARAVIALWQPQRPDRSEARHG